MRLNHRKKPTGFTLIEMVGVLAVIAILAAILVPKIFSAIEESRYNNAIASINGVKAATMNYFAKQGGFTPNDTFDNVLITNGDLERPFATRIGTAWACEVKTAATAGVGANNRFNKLDGNNVSASGNVVQCKIVGVPVADAYELSKRLDGTAMCAVAADPDGTPDSGDEIPAVGNLDDKGRVIYAAADANGLTTVYIYIAHK
ncbi:MAG: type II secretion system GspH family protein [Verrucomicrobia bacterium]|nr:type II secretion system GspH family protein [Verrucomicrobiota bacterium]